MRVLFLGVDGVLNGVRWRTVQGKKRASDLGDIDPGAVSLLNQIVASSGCVVVVSSKWAKGARGKSLNELKSILKRHGFRGLVLEATPELAAEPDSEERRGKEITAWLITHPGVKRYVIFDANPVRYTIRPGAEAELYEHLVRTDPRHGLSEDNASKALALLGTGRL